MAAECAMTSQTLNNLLFCNWRKTIQKSPAVGKRTKATYSSKALVFLVSLPYGFGQDLFDIPAFYLPTFSSFYLLLDVVNQLDVGVCIQQNNSS